MSSRMISSVVGCLVTAGLALGAIQGCGSSSSSGDPTAICTQICVKEAMCLADASAATATSLCMSSCSSAGKGGQSGTTCTNASQIESATSACLKISDCTQFATCIAGIPQCTASGTGGTSGTGTGGSTGAAGSHGTGGASATGGTSGGGGAKGTGGAGGAGATATCADCDKAGTCCTALAALLGQSAAGCSAYSTSSCNAMTGANQTTEISTCQQILSGGAALSSSCK